MYTYDKRTRIRHVFAEDLAINGWQKIGNKIQAPGVKVQYIQEVLSNSI